MWQNNQVQRRRLNVCRLQRGACGACPKRTGRLCGIGQVALPDASARDDPLVGGLDAARGKPLREFCIADRAPRQGGTGAGDARPDSCHRGHQHA